MRSSLWLHSVDSGLEEDGRGRSRKVTIVSAPAEEVAGTGVRASRGADKHAPWGSRGLMSGADSGKEGQAREAFLCVLVSGWVTIPQMEMEFWGGRHRGRGDSPLRFQVPV